MMVHRDPKGGTFIIDVQVPGVGRIKRASGTTHGPTYKRLRDMIGGLREIGRLDLLKRLKDGKLTFLGVYEFWRTGRLGELPSGEAMETLAPALTAWLATFESSAAHAKNYKSAVRRITAQAGAQATVGELPATVQALREAMRKHARMFNVVRSCALAFARDTQGKRSTLWLQVSAVATRDAKRKRRPHPVTVAELTTIAGKLAPELAAMAWTMALTGMRPTEYWGRWEDRETFVRVLGTKTASAERDVPRLERPAKPACWDGKFRRALATASGGQVQPRDLRRTFATWMEQAGIPRTRRKLYMGHAASDVTDLYEWQDIRRYLATDTATLAHWLDAERAKLVPTPDLKVVK